MLAAEESISDEEEGEVSRLSGTVRAKLIRASLQPHELEFDKDRARKVLGVLYESFVKDSHSVFQISQNAPQWKERPEEIEIRSPEHRIWLWSAASTDLRSESDVVYHEHRMLWLGSKGQLPFTDAARDTRELYQEEVLGWSDSDYKWALAKRRFGNPRRNIEWWGRRAQMLWGQWGGDPFRMFSAGSIDLVMKEKKDGKIDLPGIGPKIASLTAIFFEEIGMPPILDAFPVDIHVQQLALALRFIVPKRPAPIMNETLERILRPALAKLCAEEGWSRILLSHALWFRGNRGCTNCWRTPHTQVTCPVYHDCQGAYQSRPYFKMGLWLPEAGPMGKGGHAPLVPFHERSLFLNEPQ